ncbi:hypothetical protein GH714_024441 [Hevea brasiliensis]|uniref:Ubiquitin-like-conjugating enzyme ATG10 n=1 Tax=Hevea brasiliensis TaxID=3981 RepID=A0A6A6KWZ1_HEVBR|nr:hypothetical protein GH714_024441 [Hevea brasiliensis]
MVEAEDDAASVRDGWKGEIVKEAEGRVQIEESVDGFLSMENICLLRPSEDNGAEVSRLEEEKTSLSEKEEAIDDATLEHPYFNRPWYKLHPCGTSEWMKLLFLDEAVLAESKVAIELHLVSWFSVVGQVIGLRVPIEMVNGRIN